MPVVTTPDSAPPQPISWTRCSCILTFVCFGFLVQGASYSHLTSFFDLYGLREKALSSTQYGIIISSYCFVLMIGTPLTSKLVTLRYFKDRTLILVAWTIDASFCLILSFACELGPGHPFFFGCLVLRILEACGCAIGFIMPYVITGSEMSEYSHIIIPLLETIYGTSVVMGPALSGALYDLGGFPMPFGVLGGILMIWMILGMALFPKAQEIKQQGDETKPVSVWTALQFPVFVNALCTTGAFASISSNESTLALHLNTKFGLSVSDASLVFLYPGGLYAVSSLLLGFASKRVPDPRVLVSIGHFLSLIAFALQGPLLPIVQSETMFLFAQILFGLGTGPSLVCGYLHSLRYLSKGNETKEIHAVLSAIFIPASLIGCTIGPFFAGIVRHHYSYTGVIAANTAQTALMALLLLITTCATNKSSEDAGRT